MDLIERPKDPPGPDRSIFIQIEHTQVSLGVDHRFLLILESDIRIFDGVTIVHCYRSLDLSWMIQDNQSKKGFMDSGECLAGAVPIVDI
jgi:hypothetical protein